MYGTAVLLLNYAVDTQKLQSGEFLNSQTPVPPWSPGARFSAFRLQQMYDTDLESRRDLLFNGIWYAFCRQHLTSHSLSRNHWSLFDQCPVVV